jgi:GT2 family glycosyltransferase
MRVDVIIPNFNGSHLLKQNLPAVLESLKKYSGKIIIVDDASSKEDYDNLKGVADTFQNEKNKIELLRHKHNKGFSTTINTGINASTAEFVVLLNSDVVPSKNFLEGPLVKLTEDKDLFGIGCVDRSIENGQETLRGRGIAVWKKGLLVHKKGEIGKSDTFWISGGSSIVRREYLLEIGGFDELYNPFYWEDIDLSYRAQKSGYKLLFDNTSIVTHKHDEGAIKKHFTSKKIISISYRNQFIFIWKNITSKSLILSHVIYFPVHIYGAVKRGDMEFFAGLFLALIKLPAIIEKRRKQKKLYKLSDAQLINIS